MWQRWCRLALPAPTTTPKADYTKHGFAVFGPWATLSELLRLLAAIDPRRPVLDNPHLTVPAVAAAVISPAVTAPVRALLGDNLDIENTFVVTKPPGQMAVPAHQNGTNDRLVLDPERAVTVWLALTPATTRTGCLYVAPGSHHHGYLPTRRADVPGGPLTVNGPLPSTWIPVEIAEGHGLLMDPRLLHYSPPNNSTSPRVGLNIRFTAPGGCTMRDGSTPRHLTPVPATTPGEPDTV